MKQHRRYSEGEKIVLLATVKRAQEQSGVALSSVLAALGLTRSVYYDWINKEREGNLADHIVVPCSPLTALSEEVEATVAYAKAHPREGYRRLA